MTQKSLQDYKKIAIIGSTGFIGAALLKHFQQEPNLIVAGYNSANMDLLSSGSVDKLCEVIDRDTILIVTSRASPDKDPLDTFSRDMEMVLNVARCLSKQQIKKCVYFSTDVVCEEATRDLLITEDTAISPNSLYGTAKFASECVLKQITKKANIPLLLLRPCMVYGPGDTSHAYGPARFIKSILQEGKVFLFGDGSERRDYLFIGDLVKIVNILALGDYYGTYNLATGQTHSFQEIVGYLRQIANQEFVVVSRERDRPKVDRMINPDKLLKVLPDFRFTNIEVGLAQTYGYFTNQL